MRNKIMSFDKIDKEILSILQLEGRITNSNLAARINISAPPTLERVKKLENSGVIRRYAAILDPVAVGMETLTFVEVKLNRHQKDNVAEFIAAVGEIDEVMECHHVTGDADFLLKIAARNIATYEELVLNTLTTLPHVLNLKTMVALSTIKDETAYKIETD